MDVARNSKTDLDVTELEELDTSSGCDMSFELSSDNVPFTSPPNHHGPRRLDFRDNYNTPGRKVPMSPPYKRVRALKLFDSPLTPKTILEKSSACATPAPRTRLFASNDKPRAVASAYAKPEKPAANVNPFTPDGRFNASTSTFILKRTIAGMLLNKKRTRSIRSLVGSPNFTIPKFDLNDSDASDEVEIEQPTKRVALQVRLFILFLEV